MSDSLRDQLMKAGFKENPTTKKKTDPRNQTSNQMRNKSGTTASGHSNKGQAHKKRGVSHHNGDSASRAEKQQLARFERERAEQEKAEATRIAEKKAIKQQIKTLIETDCIKDHSGNVAYSYLLGTKVKQLFVKEEYQKKLAADELLITRLNGNTYLVPPETGAQIILLNPEWALVGGDYNSAGDAEENSEYAEYQIPDDLTW